MKKFRKYIIVMITILACLVLIGALFLLLLPGPGTEKAFNIIAMIVSTVSVSLAIHSQIHAERSRRVDERVIRDLREITQTVENDSAVDRSIRYKLDKITAQNEMIYEKLGGNLDELSEKSSRIAHDKQQERHRNEAKEVKDTKDSTKRPQSAKSWQNNPLVL